MRCCLVCPSGATPFFAECGGVGVIRQHRVVAFGMRECGVVRVQRRGEMASGEGERHVDSCDGIAHTHTRQGFCSVSARQSPALERRERRRAAAEARSRCVLAALVVTLSRSAFRLHDARLRLQGHTSPTVNAGTAKRVGGARCSLSDVGAASSHCRPLSGRLTGPHRSRDGDVRGPCCFACSSSLH